MFRDCPNARKVLVSLPSQPRSLWMASLAFQEWLEKNLKLMSIKMLIFGLVFLPSIYGIFGSEDVKQCLVLMKRWSNSTISLFLNP